MNSELTVFDAIVASLQAAAVYHKDDAGVAGRNTMDG